MSINKSIISGNLTKDAELRQTQGGTAVLSFTVAVNDRQKNTQGEWVDVPSFIPCTMFGARASKLAQYMVKGFKVAVEGKLRTSSWEKDGQRHYKTEIIVDDLEFMTRPQAQPSPLPASQVYQQPQPASQDQPILQPAPEMYADGLSFRR